MKQIKPQDGWVLAEPCEVQMEQTNGIYHARLQSCPQAVIVDPVDSGMSVGDVILIRPQGALPVAVGVKSYWLIEHDDILGSVGDIEDDER